MTLERPILYYCETCNAGPWNDGAKGSQGLEIIPSHVKRGCRVVEYNENKHSGKDVLDRSIDAML